MDKAGQILVVDDDTDVLHTARVTLKPTFAKISVESNPQQLNFLIKNNSYDVILLDMNYTAGATGGKEGLFWLKQIKENNPNQQVVMMTAYGDINLAVEAMKFGASDFVVKPWENEKLIATMGAAYRHGQDRKELNELKSTHAQFTQLLNTDGDLIEGVSPRMKQVMQMANKVAQTDANVILFGENGTGKEVLARYIHSTSARHGSPFMKVDLGAITESLFESELFGHVKGAFTDAKENKEGRLVLAGNGTLFLDEIGNLSLQMQTKLLSVLQNRMVTPVGSNTNKPIQARIISATNNDLTQMVNAKSFREDLLYRLNTIEITIPPLRERKEDIPELISHFLNQLSQKYRKPVTINDKTVRKLQEYTWPGNVRELMHALERAIIMADDNELTIDDFLLKPSTPQAVTDSLNIDETEKQLIIQAIAKHNGNISKAAKELGLGRTTIYRKMDKYGLTY